MKLLYFNFGSYTHLDIKTYFDRAGISYDVVGYSFANKNEDLFFEHRFTKCLENSSYDAVFSVNYFPLVALCCYKKGIKYISWSYDNPLNVIDIEKTLGFETNYVFLFDRIQVEQYKNAGFATVYHMPLAANSRRLEKISLSRDDIKRFSADVGFVGKLYDSDFQLFKSGMNDFQRGYLDACISSMQDMYGCYLFDKIIDDKFIDGINEEYETKGIDIVMVKPALTYAMAAEVTRIERLTLLGLLASKVNLKYYSRENNEILSKAKYMGSCRYMDEMPKIFKASRVNLNINLKISQSGVPLRVMDILGCGGFLLSSWQPEIAEYFVNGEDVVLYESFEDAFEKTMYYLENEEVRQEVARKGHLKVSELFSYENQFSKIFRIANVNI